MKVAALGLILALLLIPVVIGKILASREKRIWNKKLRGISDRYMTDEQREKQSFHMKRSK